MLKVVLTGPESTGKSRLARALAEHFDTLWVPEYARFYLSRLNRDYRQEDLLRIARGQLQWEKAWEKHGKQVLFCDTSMLVLKIWSLFKYQTCDSWITEQFKDQKDHIYLLCGIDLPWEDDPLREHPDRREELYQLYHRQLTASGHTFYEIKGEPSKRRQKAVEIVEQLLEKE